MSAKAHFVRTDDMTFWRGFNRKSRDMGGPRCINCERHTIAFVISLASWTSELLHVFNLTSPIIQITHPSNPPLIIAVCCILYFHSYCSFSESNGLASDRRFSSLNARDSNFTSLASSWRFFFLECAWSGDSTFTSLASSWRFLPWVRVIES